MPLPSATLSTNALTLNPEHLRLLPEPFALSAWQADADESVQVAWLMQHFAHWFAHHQVILDDGGDILADEPEYFPAQDGQPARIQFAHGFFNSALHEISHWTIAGAKRRLLPDLGYWYAPDGRTKEQQAEFEQVEIKPQAIEWLFARAFRRKFRVSLDNLTGDGGDGTTFKDNVFRQVHSYFTGESTLPADAQALIYAICMTVRHGQMLSADEFQRQDLDK